MAGGTVRMQWEAGEGLKRSGARLVCIDAPPGKSGLGTSS